MKTQPDETLICSLYTEKNLSTLKIGNTMGISWQTVRRILLRNGIKLRNKWASDTRKCGHCKKEQPIFSYPRRRDYICKDCQREYNRLHPRLNSRYKKYGISFENYTLMLKEQKGRCAICGKASEKRLSVDHDHKTGKVRGLLCGDCNAGIGLFKDNLNVLRNAMRYLESFQSVDHIE